MDNIMTDYAAVAANYLAAFNATNPDVRRELIAKTFTENATYTDPLASVAGHEGLDQLIAGVQQQFDGWTFALAGPVDGHGDLVRFGWSLGPEGVEAPVLGFDVAELSDGKIAAVHGFLDRVPAAA